MRDEDDFQNVIFFLKQHNLFMPSEIANVTNILTGVSAYARFMSMM